MSTTSHSRRGRRANPSPRRRLILWIVAAVVAIVLFVVLWVAIRALIARDQLLGAVPLVHSISDDAVSGDSAGIASGVAELRERAAKAESLTSDPIWRATEVLPIVGANLTAFREAAAMIHGVADEALPPLAELAKTFSVDSLSPKDGKIDLSIFTTAAPLLASARDALDSATVQAQAINTRDTVPQVGEAIDQLIGVVDSTSETVDGLATAAQVLPSMMGGDSPRTYLLLSLNNSELRATGGIPGALAVVKANDGALSLGARSSATALGQFPKPVLTLTTEEKTLYKNILGTYMQDVTFTPDFARSGELAAAMWKQKTGQTLDGVISVDPVALGYILKATGPVDTSSGVTLTSDNAAETLLSTVYSKFPDPDDQDKFFSQVTSQIFGLLTKGTTDSGALLSALSDASAEHRIHIWSAHPEEQTQMVASTLAGPLPTSSKNASGFGVYFNDATGAKMDYYVQSSIGISAAVCRADQRPNFDVRVRLRSTAPADAATSLPKYVTGDGAYGVKMGDVKTSIYVYAPAGSTATGVVVGGKSKAFVNSEHDGLAVSGVQVQLAPGESTEVSFSFVGPVGASTTATLEHTPMAGPVSTALDNYLDCDTTTTAPGGDTTAQADENPVVFALAK
ncbi:DUF4012 domain-containing protein [Glaciihabitans sp. dw_435]|uniref:DUF4012 domain-containing protein n=1 Tax=Glaciihabitans sp. dw_435 TaxID=2720081 RepID=UPI001BD5146D|nr:DUF4012 domain-containing protein [Glaciihabitans sp. dw_435]